MGEPLEPEGAWAPLLTRQARDNGRLYLRIAHRVVGDVATAEDVCQRAFMQACECAREGREAPARLRAWLVKVVINESLQVLRRRRMEGRFRDQAYGRSNTDLVRERDPALRESVELALAELPELTRAVVVLRIMHGMSGNEVKLLLGCSASEVSRRLYAGMEQLRCLLARVAADAE